MEKISENTTVLLVRSIVEHKVAIRCCAKMMEREAASEVVSPPQAQA